MVPCKLNAFDGMKSAIQSPLAGMPLIQPGQEMALNFAKPGHQAAAGRGLVLKGKGLNETIQRQQNNLIIIFPLEGVLGVKGNCVFIKPPNHPLGTRSYFIQGKNNRYKL